MFTHLHVYVKICAYIYIYTYTRTLESKQLSKLLVSKYLLSAHNVSDTFWY